MDGGQRLVSWVGPDPERVDVAVVDLGEDALTAHGSSTCAGWTLTYRLRTGPAWVTRRLDVRVADGDRWRALVLERTDTGQWSARRGEAAGEEPVDLRPLPLPDLDGALDCDLGLCPLTNAMPVLREGLIAAAHAGEARSVTLRMAWVSVPELDVSVSEQHYATSAAVVGGGAIIRFSADYFLSHLEVDADGLAVNYPNIGRRVVG